MATAIEELLENAVVHNDEEPTVRVEARRAEEKVRLRIEDNGPGIPEYERAVLQRGKETPLSHGSGLGLWLVHWIVTMNGGTLSIADATPAGTQVTITVPRPQRDEVAPRIAAAQ
ncbi:MAG: sensor histidine kinase [Halanaeroarchaeum sp.]